MFSLATYLPIFLVLFKVKILLKVVTPLLTPTPSPTTTPSTQAGGLDSTIIAALIGLAGVVVGALIAGAFALYQLQRNAQLQKDILRFQKDLEQQAKHKEQEEQHQEQEAETAQAAMQQAQTLSERVEAYRQAVRTDPRLARLQILDMTRPLKVDDIYVRLRVHQESRPGYELDAALWEAEQQHDPNVFWKIHQQRLEQRVSTAIAPEESIRTYKRCVVVGDPGAGKSTLLKNLALLSIDGHLEDLPDLPIHIELQAFASSGHRDLLEFASAIWEERYGFPKAVALEYMQRRLGEGQTLLLLDALDETLTGTTSEQAEESYLQVSKAITDLATRYPQAPIVVTARKAGYHQHPRLVGFTELEVLDFRPEDIKQFVESWFACHPDPRKWGSGADLIARLDRSARMQALATNPLLLSLIVIVYEEQLNLPERRVELYKQCVDTLLTKWDASRPIRRLRSFKSEHKRHLLEVVAWHFHLRGQRYFPERDLLEVIAAFLQDVGLQPEQNGQVLDEIVAENGLLKEQAHGWYGFLHLTMQEYCAARYAVDRQCMETLLQRRDNPWWEEVLFLYSGCVTDASPLLQQLLGATAPDGLRDDLFHTDLILAGRCLAAFPTIQQAPLREEIITRLFRVLESTSHSLTQKQAAETLAEIGGKLINPQLVALLSNEQLDWTMRRNVASALGQLGERSVAPQLVALLSNQQVDSLVRGDIARALGQLGERSIVPQLITLLSNEQLDGSERGDIARTLGQLGERSIVPQLVALLSNEQLDHNMRIGVANALGQLGERSIVPQLIALVSNQQLDRFVRRDIAQALGKLGERTVVPQLVALLSNQQLYADVRRCIASALGQLGERSIAPQLVALLSNEQVDHYIVYEGIAWALGQLGERSIAPQLVALLSNQQLDSLDREGDIPHASDVRMSIASALGQLGERAVVPQLVALLSDERLKIEVRGSIASALGQLGERAVVPQLVALLSNVQLYHAGVQEDIARALGQLGERTIVPQLIALLSTNQFDVVYEGIAWALGQLGERTIVPQLIALLSVPHHHTMRRSLPRAIESIGADEEAVQALAHLVLTSDLADAIHSMLWTVSRQLGLRIFVTNEAAEKRVEVVKWPTVSTNVK